MFVGRVNAAVTQVGTEISLSLVEVVNEQLTTLTLTLNLQAVSENTLEGEWQSSNNAKGILQLSRHKPVARSTPSPVSDLEPVEVVAREYAFNALSIYKDDIEEIIRIMEQLTEPDGSIFVMEEDGQTKRTTFAKTYLTIEKKLAELIGLAIGVQRNIGGFNSSLVLNLRQNELSNLL